MAGLAYTVFPGSLFLLGTLGRDLVDTGGMMNAMYLGGLASVGLVTLFSWPLNLGSNAHAIKEPALAGGIIFLLSGMIAPVFAGLLTFNSNEVLAVVITMYIFGIFGFVFLLTYAIAVSIFIHWLQCKIAMRAR